MALRFYLVTFDLKDSYGRNAHYAAADAALKFRYGEENFWKVIKQCRIIRTSDTAGSIKDMLNQAVGGNCDIVILQIKGDWDCKFMDYRDRRNARECLEQVPGMPL